MRSKHSGFTLIELMIVLAIIGILSVIFFNLAPREAADIEAEVTRYAANMGLGEVVGFNATESDTDGDGYVSVSLRTLEPTGYDEDGTAIGFSPVVTNLQCGTGFNWDTFRRASGCKADTAKTIRR